MNFQEQYDLLRGVSEEALKDAIPSDVPEPLASAMQVPRRIAESALRFSLSPLNTAEEIDYALSCIRRHYEMLKHYERR